MGNLNSRAPWAVITSRPRGMREGPLMLPDSSDCSLLGSSLPCPIADNLSGAGAFDTSDVPDWSPPDSLPGSADESSGTTSGGLGSHPNLCPSRRYLVQ